MSLSSAQSAPASSAAPRPNQLGQFGMVSLGALEQVAQAVAPRAGLQVGMAQAVYVTLAACASQQGTASTAEGQRCRVTVSELARRVRLSPRHVERYLGALVDAGVMRVLRRRDPYGRAAASEFVFVYPTAATAATAANSSMATAAAPPPATPTPMSPGLEPTPTWMLATPTPMTGYPDTYVTPSSTVATPPHQEATAPHDQPQPTDMGVTPLNQNQERKDALEGLFAGAREERRGGDPRLVGSSQAFLAVRAQLEAQGLVRPRRPIDPAAPPDWLPRWQVARLRGAAAAVTSRNGAAGSAPLSLSSLVSGRSLPPAAAATSPFAAAGAA